MPRLHDDDYRLSMMISRRPRHAEVEKEDLRSLLVHRLTDTAKAVARLSLRADDIGVLCEGCSKWTPVEEFPLEFDCKCGRSYATELVIFHEVTTD